jgi:nucleotide-binding universal stress UspA family protein
MTKILVPLDGSQLAESVLTQIRRLIKLGDAELVLVGAFNVPPIDVDYLKLVDRVRLETDRYMHAVENRLAGEGFRVRRAVVEGVAADTILEVADREKPSLIAMSTHGRSGLSRFVLGSVAEKVLRASAYPVLLVRSFAGHAPVRPVELPFKRVLVPVDGSELSLRVVPALAEILKPADARAVLLHVTEQPAPHWTPSNVPFEKAAHELGDACIPATHEVRVGDPATEILKACHDLHCDMIAMTTHGRTGLSRWVLGSVTEKVLRHSEVPLLVVRARQEGA